MARTDLTPTALTTAGVAPSAVAGTVDGHKVTNHGDIILVLKNTGAGAHTVTIPTPGTVEGEAIGDKMISLAAAQVKYVSELTPEHFNQSGADAGKIYLDFDATQSEVTVIALKKARF